MMMTTTAVSIIGLIFRTSLILKNEIKKKFEKKEENKKKVKRNVKTQIETKHRKTRNADRGNVSF